MARIDLYLFDEDAEAAEPTDQPNRDRRYDTRDPEGHMWLFATPAA